MSSTSLPRKVPDDLYVRISFTLNQHRSHGPIFIQQNKNVSNKKTSKLHLHQKGPNNGFSDATKLSCNVSLLGSVFTERRLNLKVLNRACQSYHARRMVWCICGQKKQQDCFIQSATSVIRGLFYSHPKHRFFKKCRP